MRMHPNDRKAQILDAAIAVAVRDSFANMERKAIAREANVTEGLVSYHFGTMKNLRRTVMRHAIKERNLYIIAEGIICRNPYALKVPDDVKKEALELVLS